MDYNTLSPLAMFLNAGPVGKAVMALLLLASIWTWVLIVEGVVAVTRIAKSARSARAGGDVGVLAPVAEAGREGFCARPSRRDDRRQARPHRRPYEPRGARVPDQGGRRPAESRRHLVGRALRRPVRHGVGHHDELRQHRSVAGHEPRGRRARHRRGACGHGLWTCRRHPRLGRLQPHRRGLRARRPAGRALHRRRVSR